MDRFELRWTIDHGRRTLEIWELAHRDYKTRDVKPQRLVSISGENLDRIRPALLEAVRALGLPPSVLAEWNGTPIRLNEEWGVRVALVAKLVGPVRNPAKVAALVDGVLDMSREEALYWFAKCFNGRGAYYTMGLRICLAGGVGE